MSRDARQLLEPPDQAIAGKALQALDAAAARSFDVAASVAAIQQEVAAAGKGGAAPGAQVQAAVARFSKLRADYAAMDDAGKQEFFNRERASPADPARTELLERMAVADLREVDFSSQLLLSSVAKQLARGNAGQFTSLPDRTLDMAVDTLWSRGITSPRPRNLLTVAREFERQVTQALLAALPDADVAALLAWRNDAQAAPNAKRWWAATAPRSRKRRRGDPDAGARLAAFLSPQWLACNMRGPSCAILAARRSQRKSTPIGTNFLSEVCTLAFTPKSSPSLFQFHEHCDSV